MQFPGGEAWDQDGAGDRGWVVGWPGADAGLGDPRLGEPPPPVQAQYQQGATATARVALTSRCASLARPSRPPGAAPAVCDIAQAERKLGQVEAALRHYEQFLKMERAITPLTRGVVQGYVNRLKVLPLGRKAPNPPRNLPELFDPMLAPNQSRGPTAVASAPRPRCRPGRCRHYRGGTTCHRFGRSAAGRRSAGHDRPPVVASARRRHRSCTGRAAPAGCSPGPAPSYGVVRLSPAAPPPPLRRPAAPPVSKPLSGRWVPVAVHRALPCAMPLPRAMRCLPSAMAGSFTLRCRTASSAACAVASITGCLGFGALATSCS